MRLVVDTSVLVGELLRVAGRTRLADHRLELFIPEQMWAELQVELPRRVSAFARRKPILRTLADDLASAALAAVESNVALIDEAAAVATARRGTPRHIAAQTVQLLFTEKV